MPGERTEQATQHRRDKARKDGDILHSRELNAAAGTLAGVLALGVLGTRSLDSWRGAYAGFLSLGAVEHWDPAEIGPTLNAIRQLTFQVLAPVAIVMAAVAAAALAAGVPPMLAALRAFRQAVDINPTFDHLHDTIRALEEALGKE